MIRRSSVPTTLAIATLLLGSALAPRASQAQSLDPGSAHPRIYCTSFAQEYCVSLMTWEEDLNYWARDDAGDLFITDDPSEAFLAQGSVFVTGQVFGSAYDGVSDPTAPFLAALTTDEWGLQVYWAMSSTTTLGPGYFQWTESTAGLPLGSDAPNYGEGPGAVTEIQFAAGVGCTPFGRVESLTACVEVPEPATLPLIATGLLGLVLLTRRRRTGASI